MNTTRTAAARLFSLLLLGLTLTACGFQPRGQAPALPSTLSPLAITGIDTDTPLYLALQRRLEGSGSTLVTDTGRAAAVLAISNLESRRELLTVSSDNKANEYELIEALSYRVRVGDRETMPQRLSASRIHYAPGDAVLARKREEDTLRQTLREELAERLLRRLAAWQ